MKLFDKFTSAEKDALDNLHALVKLRIYFNENPLVEKSLKRLTGFGVQEAIDRSKSIEQYLVHSLDRFAGVKVYDGSSYGTIEEPVVIAIHTYLEQPIEIYYKSEDGKYQLSTSIKKLTVCKP